MLHRRMAGNAGVQLAAKGVLLLLSMAVFSLLTHYLGPERYGRYNVVLSVFGMAAIVAELGLGTIAIRELAAQRDRIETILPALLLARLVLASLAILVAAGLGWALGYDAALVRLIALYALIFLARGIGAGTFGLISAAALAAWKNVIADVIESLLFVGFVIWGIATGRDLDWFVLGALASAVLASTVLVWLTRRDGPRIWAIDGGYFRQLLREAAPLAIAGLFSTLYFRLDAVMLSKMSSEAAVGIYGAAYKYVESASTISAIFLSSLFPVLAYFYQHDRAKVGAYYRQAIEWAAAFALSLALFLYAFSDSLVLLLNGRAFAEAGTVLRLCSAAIVLIFVNNIGVHVLFAARQQKHLVWINLIAVAAKFMANLVLIPRYGAVGAAVATVMSEILIAVAVFVTVRRLQSLSLPIVSLSKLGVPALLVVGILTLFQPGLSACAMLLAGWIGFLLLIGIPKPRQVLRLLSSARG